MGQEESGEKGTTLFETLTSFPRAAVSRLLQLSTADRIGGRFPQDSDFSLLSPQLPGRVGESAALQQRVGLPPSLSTIKAFAVIGFTSPNPCVVHILGLRVVRLRTGLTQPPEPKVTDDSSKVWSGDLDPWLKGNQSLPPELQPVSDGAMRHGDGGYDGGVQYSRERSYTREV